ncbi:signal peptidase II [Mucilaginibacter sp.]|uniref:signal peptidase II n=1 Tax=Mucilaginibacter sp. TaxID=1882438 RepID=UPI003D0AABF3
MKAKGFFRVILILLVLSINIGCDQVSKSIVRRKMDYYDQIGFLHNHITLSKVENAGAFLSLGDSLKGPMRIILLNLFPLIAVLFGLYYILAKTDLNRLTLFSVILIVGGGIGNLYDRIVHGSVTDFMHINFVIFQTGVFNVADVSIMIGMFLLLIQAWLKQKAEPEPGRAVEQ